MSASQGAALDGDVNGLLGEALVAINDRDSEAVRERIDRIEAGLAGVISDSVDLRLAGSVAKHTAVSGLSDIDVLAIVDEAVVSESPADVLDKIAIKLRSVLASDAVSVSVGTLAVTVRFQDGTEIQVLPAVDNGSTTLIPNSGGTGWAAIDARGFATKLTAENSRLNGRLVPTIKLVKSVLRNFIDESQLPTGYHVESLAISAFRNYDGPQTLKGMVQHFFTVAPELVTTPIRDSSGQSVHVDEYLGDAGSQQRSLLSHALGRIDRRIRYATTLQDWASIVGVDT